MKLMDNNVIDFTLSCLPENVLWTEMTGRIVRTNTKMAGRLNYEIEELEKLTIFDVIPSINRLEWREVLHQLKKEKNLTFHTQHFTKQEELFSVESTLSLLEFDGKQLVFLISKEITKNTPSTPSFDVIISDKGESDLLRQMHGYAFENVSDMVFWVNQFGKFIYINDAVCHAHGISKEAFLDKFVWDVAPLVKKEVWQSRWEGFKEKKHIEYQSIHRKKDGSEFPVDVNIHYIEFKEKDFLCCILKDITTTKEHEKEMEDALVELKRLKDLLQAENEYLQADIRLQHNFDEILTISSNYQKMLEQVEFVAPTHATVLILGETGTGKELVARAIHRLSARSQKILVKINCATLPDNLIESELFGHEKGAFTGASSLKIGRFELADKGTIFLDEIGELPFELQAKLLRVLQSGEFSRLGSNVNFITDVRVLAATNRNLEKLVEEGKFREDLYYRLNVFPIINIPLRERREDISVLVQHFVQKYSEKTGRNITKISRGAMDKLLAYDYPGNIRELENIIERAVILSQNETLKLHHWKMENKKQIEEFASFEDIQKRHILEALKHCEGRVSGSGGAAELLKINAKTLDSKMRKFGIRRKNISYN